MERSPQFQYLRAIYSHMWLKMNFRKDFQLSMSQDKYYSDPL